MSFFRALFDINFKEMITGKIVTVLYILSMIVVAIYYIIAVIAGFTNSFGYGLLALIFGAVIALFSLAYVRVVLELFVVLFRIYESVRIMAQNSEATNTTFSDPPPAL